MEKQFALMHERPDLVIATPGRFVHLGVSLLFKFRQFNFLAGNLNVFLVFTDSFISAWKWG
jgi:hypothetical protein